MMTLSRAMLIAAILLPLGLGLNGCGAWRGSDDVSTDYGSDAVGKGPGLVTGKRGGIVIYQK